MGRVRHAYDETRSGLSCESVLWPSRVTCLPVGVVRRVIISGVTR